MVAIADISSSATFDVAIIGGGIAGMSAAAMIAQSHSVILLERETQPGYHASGRSAALFSETYGNEAVRALSVAGRKMLEAPPSGAARAPLLTPRGAMHFGAECDGPALDRLCAQSRKLVPSVRRMTSREVCETVGVMRPDAVSGGGVLEPDAMDIDTNEVLQLYLRLFRKAGGVVATAAEVQALERSDGGWAIATKRGDVRARIIVNAAGAWADEVAVMAGALPIGLTPCRRTAFVFRPDYVYEDIQRWPLTIGADEALYFKPDAGALLVSPADETPVAATDVQPEELDIAIAAQRLEELTTLRVRRIDRSWAGLRTFSPDRTPVVGFEARIDGFFWLAGQGGYGFQTAPALATIAGTLIDGRDLPDEMQSLGLTRARLSPDRFDAPETETEDRRTEPAELNLISKGS